MHVNSQFPLLLVLWTVPLRLFSLNANVEHDEGYCVAHWGKLLRLPSMTASGTPAAPGPTWLPQVVSKFLSGYMYCNTPVGQVCFRDFPRNRVSRKVKGVVQTMAFCSWVQIV